MQNLFNNKNNQVINLESLFIYLGLFYVFNFLLATTLVTFSIFNIIPFYFILGTFFVGLVYIFLTRKIDIDIIDLIAFITTILFGIFSYIFFHHTLYGVRDEGVYANSAIGVITKGSIYIKDFINFPGWEKHGNVFVPQFLFGTSSWIALNYAFFGLKGIYMSNILPMIIGGLSYYYIAKPYLKNKSIHLLYCFFLSYPMLWFTRRTVSELIFFALLWFSFYLLNQIYIKKKINYLFLLIATCSSYILVRGEGMVYLLITCIILLIINWKNKFVVGKYSAFSLLFLLPFLFYSFFVDNNYLILLRNFGYKIFTKFFVILHIQTQRVLDTSPQILHTPGSLYYNILPYTLYVFSNYDLLFFIFSVFLCLLYLLSKRAKDKNKIFLIVLIIINLPTFYSFFDLTISPDQPWFLRRYLFSVIPLAFLCGFVFVNEFIKSSISKNLIFIMFIFINLVISQPILLFSEYKEMPQHVDNLAKIFTSKDIIFVDQYANGWYRLYTELYFRKNIRTYYITAYEVNTYNINGKNIFSDLRKINLDNYNNIYILTSENSQIAKTLEEPLFKKFYNYTISYTTIVRTSDLYHLPNTPNNNIFNLNFDDLKSQITVPNNIYTEINNIVVYKVTSKRKFEEDYGFINSH